MSLDLERLRGGDRLDAGTLRGSVLELLRSEPALRTRRDDELHGAIDELLGTGVGLGSALSAYAQGLTLLAAALLRLAGANLDATRAEVQQRDEAGLEALIGAIVGRLRGAAGLPQPPPAIPAPPVSEGAPDAWAGEVASAPFHDRQKASVPVRTSPRPAADSGVESGIGERGQAAAGYLRALVTPAMAAVIEGMGAARPTSAPSAAPAARQPAAWVELPVEDGIAVMVRGDVLERIAAAGDADLPERVGRGLSALLGGLRPA
jgi:hypothetical protein